MNNRIKPANTVIGMIFLIILFVGFLFFPFVFSVTGGLYPTYGKMLVSVRLFGLLRIFQGYFSILDKKIVFINSKGKTKKIKKESNSQKRLIHSIIPLKHNQIIEIGTGFDLMYGFGILKAIELIFSLPQIRQKVDRLPLGFHHHSVLLSDRFDLKLTTETIVLWMPIVLLYHFIWNRS